MQVDLAIALVPLELNHDSARLLNLVKPEQQFSMNEIDVKNQVTVSRSCAKK